MKNAIIMVSILSLAIVFTVLIISYAKESPDRSSLSPQNQYSDPVQDFDFQLYIVTSEAKFWDRVAALKATEAPEITAMTDEDGNPVTDEDGNIIPVNSDDQSEEEYNNTPVTEIPDNNTAEDTTKQK